MAASARPLACDRLSRGDWWALPDNLLRGRVGTPLGFHYKQSAPGKAPQKPSDSSPGWFTGAAAYMGQALIRARGPATAEGSLAEEGRPGRRHEGKLREAGDGRAYRGTGPPGVGALRRRGLLARRGHRRGWGIGPRAASTLAASLAAFSAGGPVDVDQQLGGKLFLGCRARVQFSHRNIDGGGRLDPLGVGHDGGKPNRILVEGPV